MSVDWIYEDFISGFHFISKVVLKLTILAVLCCGELMKNSTDCMTAYCNLTFVCNFNEKAGHSSMNFNVSTRKNSISCKPLNKNVTNYILYALTYVRNGEVLVLKGLFRVHVFLSICQINVTF